MRNLVTFIMALITYLIIHEGLHALLAMPFGEFKTFQIHPLGIEVIYQTPVAEREGIKWGFISGVSNVVTLSLGYLLLFYRLKIAGLQNKFYRGLGFWLVVIFMLADAINLSVAPFIVGGDIGGVVKGFGVNQYLVQIVFFAIFLINRELIAQKIIPAFGIQTKHFFVQPLIRFKNKV